MVRRSFFDKFPSSRHKRQTRIDLTVQESTIEGDSADFVVQMDEESHAQVTTLLESQPKGSKETDSCPH